MVPFCSKKFTLFPGDRKETRSVTSRYHGNKISGSQQSFFQKRPFALSNDGSHSRQFFFLQYLQDLGLLKSRNFATMATWRKGSANAKNFACKRGLVVKFARLTYSCIRAVQLWYRNSTLMCVYKTTAKRDRELKCTFLISERDASRICPWWVS